MDLMVADKVNIRKIVLAIKLLIIGTVFQMFCVSSLHYVKQVCAAEMAVRYAALCACRKVHTLRWPISENRSFSILDVRS